MREMESRLAALPPEARRLLELRLQREKREIASAPVRRGADRAPLSFAQRRLWFLDRLQPGALYNSPLTLRVHGALNAAALERALEEVVRRHEALRSVIRTDGTGEPEQVVLPHEPFVLAADDLSAVPSAAREEEVRRRVHDEIRRPFDLARGPLFRARLLRLGADDHVLVLAMHHVVSDGWSLGVLFRELGALYEAFSRGAPSPLGELPLQYADYAAWQREHLDEARLAAEEAWWRRALEGAPAVLELPPDRPRPPVQSHRGARLRVALPHALAEDVRALARREGATSFMVMLAAFHVLLWRWSGQTDVVVGSPVAGRTRAETEGLIGFFVNTLALRADLSGDPPFRALLHRVRDTTLGAYQHQELPFERLVEALRPDRSLSHAPVFQTVFALQNSTPAELTLPGVRMEVMPTEIGTARFDMEWLFWEREEGITGAIDYATDLFDAATVERMAGQYRRLLEGAVARPDAAVSDLPLMDAEERRRVLEGWNATSVDYPRDRSIASLFEAQAAATPDAVAVVADDERITYRALNERANRLAHHLARHGVRLEARVGIGLPRGAETVVAMLAALKLGAAYVPLDPAYPAERLRFMLADVGVAALVTRAGVLDAVASSGTAVVSLDVAADAIAAERAENPSVPVPADALAYVMYTSGSTGTPKGVAVPHRGVVRLVRGANYAHYGPDEVIPQVAPVSFDASTMEIWGALLNGGRTVVVPQAAPTLAELGRSITGHGATTVWLTAGLFQVMVAERLDDLRGVRQLLAGGDVVAPDAVRAFQEGVPGCRLIIGYGPTENTTFTSCHTVPPGWSGASVPIGTPVSNTRVYVLDPGLRPLPPGVPGELYTAGDGLARGYLGRPGATAESFLPDPFSDRPGARMYRTRDRARWKGDGTLEFMGRLDGQVKIRGFRIEPGEVESVLRRHPSLAEALVVPRGAPGARRLVAYVVPAAGAAVDTAELRAHLRASLPDFMVPQAFAVLDGLPLTPNGKVDRAALPEPDDDAAAQEFVAPRTEAEAVLAGVWAQVLGRARVGVHDDFFALGGHSLLAAQAMTRAAAALGVELPLRALFEAPTVAALAARLESEAGDGARPAPPIAPAPADADPPLSFAQERFWVAHRLEGGGAAYHIPAAWRLRGPLHADALKRALREIVRRHEPLRTGFALRGTHAVQVIHPVNGFTLPLDDLADRGADAEEAARRMAREEAERPFDLEHGPMVRARLLRLAHDDHVLLLVVHHAAGDGWSFGVLARELAALYAAFARGESSPLTPLPVRYSDYAAWQRAWLAEGEAERQAAYWRERLAGVPPALALPTDRPRPARLTPAGAHLPFALPAETVARVGALARGQDATLFMALAAAFAAVLGRWSGEEDVVVGTPVANRRRPELEGLVGCFVNTLALRTDLAGAPSFRALLGRVRESTLGALAHQDLPFDQMVDALRVERSAARHPVFQALLSLQNMPGEELSLDGVRVERFRALPPTSPFDLSINLAPDGKGGLRGLLEYAADLFDADTAERLFRHLSRMLDAAAADPDAPVSSLPLMDDEERRRVLDEWSTASARHPRGATLHGLFARAAAASPDAVAIVGDGAPVTYAELDARAERIARRLRGAGAGGRPVALAMERSAAAVAAMLGVLKAGGAWVPVDPAHPAERLRFVVEDSGAAALVVADEVPDGLRGFAGPVVSLAGLADAADSADRADIDGSDVAAVDEDAAAYVIYTSGSTGTPKGVVVPHRAAIRLVCGGGWLDVGPGDGVLHVTALTFDVAVNEVWGALLNGARLVVVPGRTPALREIGRAIREHGATIFLPSVGLFNAMVDERPDDLRGLRYLEAGGEALSVPHVRRALERLPGVVIGNGYGPTENGIITTRRIVRPADVERPGIPIGEPVPGTRAYVLDSALRPVPVGVPGELCAAGDGLALGYAGRPELTAERFVTVDLGDGMIERVYRTGDRARWLPEGTLEYLGRLDGQVKVRGYRVEPGEVEAALVRHPRVAASAVMAREDRPGDARLVAYVVGRDGAAPGEAELRAFLAERLPEHLVPSAWVPLPALPYTAGGKVDRRALPAPAAPRSADAAALPDAGLERRIAAAWAELLGVERVGAEENFFELGGTSLLLIALHERLAQMAPEAVLDVVELFRHTTVRAQARRLAGQTADAVAETAAAPRASATGQVAVVGLAGRFPGAPDVEAFWRNLRGGVDCISRFSREELLEEGYPAGTVDDPHFVPARGYLEGAEWFDAAFFGYSPRDADIMDPQQRVFLETAWEALEHAGYAPGGRVGVFAGQSASGYLLRLLADDALMRAAGSFAVHMNNDKDFLATRVSYKLGLQGPALSVQTACSTSLVAVHQACRSLLAGECDTALAGGATVGIPARGGYLYEDGGISSPDGTCRPFDADAAGSVPGSGAGVVVLRRLEDALADGDTIHAVILGSAINNDGALKVGFTAPSVDGQAGAVRGALAAAGVPAETVTYVETHGTATTLGDPVEIAALAEAFGTGRPGSCALGAVKAGIGHLDAAAGVAGLIKTVLMLRHREIPPTPHFRAPNPRIGMDATPFYVNAALRPWETEDGSPRRAGVSSFGMGGTNAHVVLQEAPDPAPAAPSRPHQLLVLSARTPAALEAATDRLAAHLAAHPETGLADAAFTLREGRRALPHRRALVVRAGEDAAALLAARAPGRVADGAAAERPSVAFLFPGLGDHYPGMGRGLYESEPVYRAEVDRCAEILRPHLGFDVREVLYPLHSDVSPPAAVDGGARIDLRRMLGRGPADPAAERLNRTEAAQPAVFVTGWALAKLWESWGVRPEAVAGHSLGEYVAATIADVFDLEDALELVALRAGWIQALPGGAMLAVALSAEDVAPFLVPGASVATVNTPESCVVAGAEEAVEAVRAALQGAGHVARRLPTTHAFHTGMMAPVAERLAERAARMTLRPPAIPLLSNVTGTWMTDRDAADPAYWARHLCQPVRFGDAMAELLREGGRMLVEAGPGQTLGAFVRQQPRDAGRPVPLVVPSLRGAYENADDCAWLLSSLGRLWTAGVQPDWAALSAGERRRRVPLPTYPWERTRHWVDMSKSVVNAPAPPATEKTTDLADWFYVPGWRRTLAPPAPAAPEHRREWLVLADDEGAGEAVAARLWEMKQAVSIVRAGDSFARTPEGWTVRPGQADDFRAVLSALAAEGRAPDHVLHFWALPAAPDDEDAADALARWSERGWHALRALAAALDAEGGERPVDIQVIASQTAAVESADRVVPEKALLLGALRVMGQEEPRLACRAADFPPAAPGTGAWERRTARILAEVLSPEAEPAVAWRGAHRHAQAWEPAPVRADHPPARILQKHGVYLVTGGLGRVGMLLAGWLARTARARLVLTARTPFPARGEWNAWLAAHPAEDGTSRRIRALRRMEEAGGEVHIAAVDAADEAAMRALVEDVRVRWGRLDGVIHAAGQVSGPSLHRRLATLTREDAEAQFRAKVLGTRVLERVLPPETEFVVLLSSLTAVLGGLGMGAYGAANAFQDAFATARHDAGGTAWISTAWDGWPDAMDEDDPGLAQGIPMGTLMTATEAVESFRRALRSATVPHLVVAAAPLQPRLERWVTARAEPAFAAPAADAAEAPRSPRALLGIGEAYVAPRTDTERALERLWGQLLGVDAIGVHDDFFRLGGHSLLGTRLIGRVRQELGAELPMEALFRAPTLARMAAEIDASRVAEADPALLAELLADVRELSAEQVQALLQAPEDDGAPAGEGA